MARCAAKHHAHKVSLRKVRETTLTGGGGSQGVGKLIQGRGAGDYFVWVGKVGPFGVNGKEDRAGTYGVSVNDHREEREKIRR